VFLFAGFSVLRTEPSLGFASVAARQRWGWGKHCARAALEPERLP